MNNQTGGSKPPLIQLVHAAGVSCAARVCAAVVLALRCPGFNPLVSSAGVLSASVAHISDYFWYAHRGTGEC